MITGRIVSINSSPERGGRKIPQAVGELRENHGLAGDAHAGEWHRQLSLLDQESIDVMAKSGFDVMAGDFAENITTSGVELHLLAVGTRLSLGEAVVEVTQIGKECHAPCDVARRAGVCVMPQKGIFARVLKGGCIRAGDAVGVVPPHPPLRGTFSLG